MFMVLLKELDPEVFSIQWNTRRCRTIRTSLIYLQNYLNEVNNLEKNFYIKTLHFYSFEYHENDKTMIVELDFRDKILYLTPTMITKWEEPFDDIEISPEEKLRILNNIRECLLERRRPEQVIIDVESERT